MARITCEDCLEKVGDHNRFNLIHLAVKRIKQHRQGEPFLVNGKNQEIVMTLREIAAGEVTFDNIKDLPDQMPETGSESDAVNDILAKILS
ncbi:DNA-directed RNA polymerase subunit omega [Desulfopila sp. IMCC35006]|uniref:DNA-directed RNA polymerase subunit omega n=1 Tax=Desulfopila sp. IMCC35006 TaxID=2569542 RepID=UPI0010AD91DB|nr:DNA-directed RNA polymerase subunit omega [Desulfopila sp. IMCC35006]TKB26432.1 DNA-directed RNA polymerase subunit omega [Desulfopila sp. IMCC35006]